MTKDKTEENDKKLLILVVEDNFAFVEVLQKALSNFQLLVAKTVEDAKTQYQCYFPDITFLDISLPDGTGHEVLQYIQALDADAFVVMLTSSSFKHDVAKSIEKGAQGYILKPCSRERILRYIDDYKAFRTEKSRNLMNLIQTTPTLPTATTNAPQKAKATAAESEEDRFKKLQAASPILFVSSSEENRQNFKQLCEKKGYVIDTATKEIEVGALLEKKHYPILVIDCQSPTLDGYQLANQIKRQDHLQKRHRIIVGIGTENMQVNDQKWLLAGMTHFYVRSPDTSFTSLLFKLMQSLPDEYIT